jgi:hypothetical protein
MSIARRVNEAVVIGDRGRASLVGQSEMTPRVRRFCRWRWCVQSLALRHDESTSAAELAKRSMPAGDGCLRPA